ncbi:enoyl-CoA hydratase [Afipia sp. P52-10]|uniref:enoyl-CoA hydratase/isomerase family protein n=1 Tax=Afipia sp. P52-10 TaxID=1429916 RepID=UPI0003DF0ABD|nr:enoyl-CoA hydratase-related protein [Afipia sp. P52-10]ETR76896.1 enoyl-CoA hydratase [Afipia sp. P52-10]
MSDAPVLTEVRDHVGIVTFNRPKRLNAIDVPTLQAIEAALAACEVDERVRVIVFTGTGDKAFMAGGDIEGLNTRRGLAHYVEFSDLVHRVFRRIELCDKPTIAAVNGYALGGGMELLLATDIRLLADTARIGLTEIALGLFPGGGGTQRAPRQMALCVAKELMFTGDHLSAQEAVQLGLANRVVPRADLMQETLALAGRIAEKSPLVLKLMKRAIANGTEMTLAAGLAYEASMVSLVFDSEDAHEGCRAFLEKRKPTFKGR